MRSFLAPGERGAVLDGADSVADLVERGVVAQVDWSGEDHEGQLVQFVARRLAAFGIDAQARSAVEAAARGVDAADLARGEYVPAVLRAVDEALSTTDAALGELRCGDDAFRVGVVLRTAANLATWGLGRPARDLLYVIDCPCGGMNVWQLPDSDPPPGDGDCDSCGRALFDPSGTPLVSMSVEPA